jgi:hypothetical protein
MVRSNGDSGNGEQQDYNLEVEFKYLDADVWIETNADGNQDVAYTQDVLDKMDDEEQSRFI